MPASIHEMARATFAQLVEREEMTLIDEGDEVHIIADDWTLVIQGEPPTSVMIALDDESGDPTDMLTAAIGLDELTGLRALDSAVNGAIVALLAASPDPLARALAIRLRA